MLKVSKSQKQLLEESRTLHLFSRFTDLTKKPNKNSQILTLCRGYWRGCSEPWIARNSRPKKRALRWAPLVFVEKIHWNFETAKEKCVNKTFLQLSILVCKYLNMGIRKSSQLFFLISFQLSSLNYYPDSIKMPIRKFS